MENLINRFLRDFPFSESVMFRLATYAELKSDSSNRYQALSWDFKGLGPLTIYPQTCVPKTRAHHLYYLNKGRNSLVHAEAMNHRLGELFNHIFFV